MKDQLNFLVVEDSISDLNRVSQVIKSKNHNVIGASSLKDALGILNKEHVDVLLTDIHLSEKAEDVPHGLLLLRDVKMLHPNVMAIAMSNDPKVETFDRALAYGALQFLKKPIESWDDIGIALNLASRRKAVEEKNRSLDKQKNIPHHLANKYPDGIVISEQIRRQLVGVAKHKKIPLVIYGETGTGKEEAAKIVHRERCANEGDIPFVAVNCAHLKSSLAQAKLFGHKKGAFTGANESVVGYVGAADGGILFLDEVHTLSIECQQDLLRVLQSGEYQRLGDSKDHFSNFQVIVASTKDLDQEIFDGRMILDLRSRIIGQDIELVPLRERKEDIPDLVEVYFAINNIEIDEEELFKISAKCIEYYWQGNIRMLYQVLDALVMQAQLNGSKVTVDYLPEFKLMLSPVSGHDATDNQASERASQKNSDMQVVIDSIKAGAEGQMPLSKITEEVEKYIIQKAFKKVYHLGKLAKTLSVSRSTLDKKRKNYGINFNS